MSRLTKLAAKLYPRWWRERYGEEFAALLEDSRPGLRSALDVVKGAFAVRMTSPPSRRIAWAALAFGLAGSVMAILAVPAQYSSIATVSAEPPGIVSFGTQVQQVYSRTELANLIRKFDLYLGERNRQPMEEVFTLFRDNLQITRTTPDTFKIEFHYPDPSVAQMVVRAVSAKFDRPAPTTVSADPYSLRRLRAGFTGLVTGASLALLFALLAFVTRRTTPLKAFVACAGLGIAAAIAALTVPSTITSSARLSAPGLEDASNQAQLAARGVTALRALPDEALKAAITEFRLFPELSPAEALVQVRRNLRVAPVRLGPTVAEAVEFTYRDFHIRSGLPYLEDSSRFDAYRFVNWVVSRLLVTDRQLHGPSGAFEVLDPASQPILPSRFATLVGAPPLGIIVGTILALIVYLRRRPISRRPQLKEA